MFHVMLYDTGDARNEYNEPLGIEVIAARLIQRFGQDIHVELKWHARDGVPVFSDDDKPNILGVSLHIGQMGVFRQLYEQLGLLSQKPLVLAGNVGATYGYELLLREYPNMICMLGEGEEAFVQIVESMSGGMFQPQSVCNLAYCRDGEIRLTSRKEADLTQYVKPVRMFNEFLRARGGLARAEGSRGCAWQRCSFCSVKHKYNASFWRPVPVETVIAQIEDLAAASFRSVYFTDEDFVGSSPDRLELLLGRLEEVCLKNDAVRRMDYFISIKASDLLNERIFGLLRRFAQAGLREIFIGIESGCDSQLKRYCKRATKESNRRALKRADELGIDVDIGFILFDPETTVAELEENIQFIEQTDLCRYGANFIKRLRIQPFTQAMNIFSGREHTLELDRLEYRYRFKDPLVQKIYDLYERQSMNHSVYQVQNVYRGEVPSQTVRLDYKRRLVELRKQQLNILKNIIRDVTDET